LDISFDANMSRNERRFQEGKEMEEQFREKMNQYFLKKG